MVSYRIRVIYLGLIMVTIQLVLGSWIRELWLWFVSRIKVRVTIQLGLELVFN